METEKTLIRKYPRTNLFIIDESLWNWAQFRSKELGKDSVAEYIFDLIRTDKVKASMVEVSQPTRRDSDH